MDDSKTIYDRETGVFYREDDEFAWMYQSGLRIPPQPIKVEVPDAKTILENAFKYYLKLEKKELVWLPEYDSVAKWLSNNEGKGLLLLGGCGLGKSMLSRFILPAILAKYNIRVRVYDPWELNKNIDDILGGGLSEDTYSPGQRAISIDDLGCEGELNEYGNKRVVFTEIMDATEKQGKLIIISTNLNKDSLLERYGARTFDRIISTTKRIEFKGNSLRE